MLDESKDNKVGMLLDIDHFYGDSEGRMLPVILTLCIGLAPLLLYGLLLYMVIPFLVFLPFELIWFLRVGLLILGRERERIVNFNKQRNDIYQSTQEVVSIKNITSDGLIEYTNGKIEYLLVLYCGTVLDELQHTQNLTQLLRKIPKTMDFDIYIHNITDTSLLYNKYENIKFVHEEYATEALVKILDYNRSLINSASLLQRTTIAIKSSRNYRDELKSTIEKLLAAPQMRQYKTCRIADREEAYDIISRDINGLINIDDILIAKYAKKEYFGSKVLYFDTANKVTQEKKANITGFMEKEEVNE